MSHAPHTPGVVNPNLYAVAPQLVGRPLAGRGRRLMAMAIDLVLIGLVAMLFSSPAIPVGVAAAYAVFALLGRLGAVRALSRQPSLGARLGGAAVAFALVLGLNALRHPKKSDEHGLKIAVNATVTPTPEDGSDKDDADAEARAGAKGRVVPAVATEPAKPGVPREEQLAQLRRENEELTKQVDALKSEVEGLKEKVTEAEEDHGILSFLAGIAHELGLGVGWSALYFMGFLVLWRGQTPGKRMMRIRVVRVDGKPIGWWTAFERFDGYVTSLFSGLLGFLQIFWDHNRQCHHDKVSETLVLDDVQPIVDAHPVAAAR